jgi:hypothetical protein
MSRVYYFSPRRVRPGSGMAGILFITPSETVRSRRWGTNESLRRSDQAECRAVSRGGGAQRASAVSIRGQYWRRAGALAEADAKRCLSFYGGRSLQRARAAPPAGGRKAREGASPFMGRDPPNCGARCALRIAPGLSLARASDRTRSNPGIHALNVGVLAI